MALPRLAAVVALTAMAIGTSLAGNRWNLRPDGIGPIKIGMTLPQLNSLLREKFARPRNHDDQACFYVRPVKHPHISMMIEDGQLVRIDIHKAGISTKEGVQVGDSEQHALQVYGAAVKVEPHKYNPVGHYLTIPSNDGSRGIRFETDKGKIQELYAGTSRAIQYVEGCQ